MAVKKFVIHGKTVTYHITAQGNNFDITIIDGNKHEKKLVLTDALFDQTTGNLFFTIDKKPYKAHIAQLQDGQEQIAYNVSFSYKKNSIAVHQHREQTPIVPAVYDAASPSLSLPQTSPSSLKSPLAGRVSKVFIQSAQHVEKGQPLFLVESMKMENEICASRSAFIKTIFIAEGNVVQQNQILVDFEEEGEADATAKNAHEQKTV